MKPIFGASLLWNAAVSWFKALPSDIPLQVFIAGSKDRYVSSPLLKQWVKLQKRRMRTQEPVIEALYFPNAHHDITNDPNFVNVQVGTEAARFARDQSQRLTKYLSLSCAGVFGSF